MGRLEFAKKAFEDWSRLRPGSDLGSLRVIQKLIWTSRLSESILERAAIGSGLRLRGDYEVLALLRRTEPVIYTPVEVAALLGISPSGMTGKLDRLEKQGLLVRRSDPHDRRVAKLHLTDSGRTLADEAFDRTLIVYEAMLDDLDNRQIRSLDDLLTALLKHLEFLDGLPQPWNR